MRHATARAIERLENGFGKCAYQSPMGLAACGAKVRRAAGDWFRSEDAYALLCGEQYSYVSVGSTSGSFEVERRVKDHLPTCPKCAVLVDEKLEKAKAP